MKYTISDTFQKIERIKIKSKSQLECSLREFKDFNELTEERRIELQEDAKKLQERFIKDDKIGINYYHIITCITLFDKNANIDNHTKYKAYEILSLLIETVDPTLKLLKISMCSRTDFEIEKKANRLFGFYDSDLIDYEREYARRFYRINKDRMIKKLEP